MAVAAGSFFISRRVVSSAGLLLLCAGVPGERQIGSVRRYMSNLLLVPVGKMFSMRSFILHTEYIFIPNVLSAPTLVVPINT